MSHLFGQCQSLYCIIAAFSELEPLRRVIFFPTSGQLAWITWNWVHPRTTATRGVFHGHMARRGIGSILIFAVASVALGIIDIGVGWKGSGGWRLWLWWLRIVHRIRLKWSANATQYFRGWRIPIGNLHFPNSLRDNFLCPSRYPFLLCSSHIYSPLVLFGSWIASRKYVYIYIAAT